MFCMDLEGAVDGPGVPKTTRTAVYKCPEDGRPDNQKYPTVVETPDGSMHVTPPILSDGNMASMPFYDDFTNTLNSLLAFDKDDAGKGAVLAKGAVPAKYDLRAWEERGKRAWMAEWHAIHGVKGPSEGSSLKRRP